MFHIAGVMTALLYAGWLAMCLLGGVTAELLGSQFWRGLTFAMVATLLLLASFRLAQMVVPRWSDSGHGMPYCSIALAIWTPPAFLVFWLMF